MTRHPTVTGRSLPDFLVIGGQRCGTTSLHSYLSAHPDLSEGLVKEVQYFTLNWAAGEHWYRSHFPARRPGRQVFESSPYYLFHPLAASRAAAVLPDAKLVVLLRDPVQRAWSHYRHSVRLGHEPLPFEQAVHVEHLRLRGEARRLVAEPGYASQAHRSHSYLARGRYTEQLEVWLRHYPREQLLVLFSEDFFADPAGSYERVTDFLGVARWRPPRFVTANAGVGTQRLDDGVRRDLQELFIPEAAALSDLLHRPTPWPWASGAAAAAPVGADRAGQRRAAEPPAGAPQSGSRPSGGPPSPPDPRGVTTWGRVTGRT